MEELGVDLTAGCGAADWVQHAWLEFRRSLSAPATRDAVSGGWLSVSRAAQCVINGVTLTTSDAAVGDADAVRTHLDALFPHRLYSVVVFYRPVATPAHASADDATSVTTTTTTTTTTTDALIAQLRGDVGFDTEDELCMVCELPLRVDASGGHAPLSVFPVRLDAAGRVVDDASASDGSRGRSSHGVDDRAAHVASSSCAPSTSTSTSASVAVAVDTAVGGGVWTVRVATTREDFEAFERCAAAAFNDPFVDDVVPLHVERREGCASRLRQVSERRGVSIAAGGGDRDDGEGCDGARPQLTPSSASVFTAFIGCIDDVVVSTCSTVFLMFRDPSAGDEV
jgi:hypothetical protein